MKHPKTGNKENKRIGRRERKERERLEKLQEKQRSLPLPSARFTRLILALCAGLMAALAVFTLIYFLIRVPQEDLLLPPGVHKAEADGIYHFTVRTGAVRVTVSGADADTSMLKKTMYVFVLQAEAVLLTLVGVLTCLCRIFDSVRTCRSLTRYAAGQVSFAGLTVLAGSVLCSFADAFAEYVTAKTFLTQILEEYGTKPHFHASFPIGAWIGGFCLIIVGALAFRVAAILPAEPPVPGGQPMPPVPENVPGPHTGD